MRWLWILLGGLSLVAGAAGVVLPLVPATPFLLLSAFAFSRGSPRLEAWLIGHSHLGPPIRNWRDGGTISRRAKRTALAVMAVTFAGSWLVGVGTTVLLIQFLALAGAGLFVATRPEPSEAVPAAIDCDRQDG
ncbi:DUF454 family protein [Aurantimonas aggregata]|uniref:DUF454 family protein n=2 Tax=Aurantimonas aggregata TaxID=2047720 RepID=A0A6L9MLD5_9HYPH|nr:DUF454 family protein [Aurantimonas aggregata]